MAARRTSNILDIVSINDGTPGATATQTVPPGRRGRPRSARVRAAVVRAAAQLIMQDVIDDFAPHIETEIKRRLAARMERLLSQYE